MKVLKDIVNCYRNNPYSIYTREVKGLYYDDTPGVQIVYVLEGAIRIKIYERDSLVEEGELFIFNRFETRFIYAETEENLCIILNLPLEAFKAYGDNYRCLRFENYIDLHRLKGDFPYLLSLVYKNSLERSYLKRESRELEDLVRHLGENYINDEFSLTGLDDKFSSIEMIEDLVFENNLEKLSLTDLEDRIHLSSSYISKIFNEVCGIKFTEYVQQFKLCHACYGLLFTDKGLEEISSLVAFNSSRSLNRLFDKYLGLTPSEYRRSYIDMDGGFRFKSKLESFINLSGQLSYKGFLEKFKLDLKDEYELDLSLDYPKKKLFKSWLIMRNLSSIGNDHSTIMDNIASEVDINEVALRFKYNESTDSFYFADLDQERDPNFISLFLNTCLENDIVGVVSLEIDSLSLEDPHLEENLLQYKKLLEYLEDSVGSSGMREFSYIFDIRDVNNYLDDDLSMLKYRNYIREKHRYLEEIFGNQDYKWGFELGNLTFHEVETLKKVHRKLYNVSDIMPSIYSLNYRHKETLRIGSLEELDKMQNYERAMMRTVKGIKEELKVPVEKIYIRGLYRHIDISKIDLKYRDLFMVQLMLNSTFLLSGEVDFVTDYMVKDSREEKGYYYPRVLDDLGFYTPVYWSIILLSKLRGGILHRGDGYLVTRYKDELLIVVYGNLFLDHLYARQCDYKNLSDHKYKLNYKIKGLRGNYKITSERLSFENGSVFYSIGNKDNYKYISKKEKDYIRKISAPSYNLEIKTIEGSYEDTIVYSPFNIILKRYKKF